MATLYFNTETNKVFSANAVTGDEAVSQGRAIKVDSAPDGIEQWRMTYNPSTKAVDVYADGEDEAGAQAQRLTDDETQAAADKKKMDEEAAAAAG
jgi:hypothetical protein